MAPTPDTHPTLAYRLEGRRWRGKLPRPAAHAHPLVRRLFSEANAQRTTLKEIGLRAGLRPGTVAQWGRKTTPKVSDLEACLNALGLEIIIREKRA